MKRHRAMTSLGEVELPILYRDLSALFAFFPVTLARAETLYAGTSLEPVRFVNGSALTVVSFFDYRDTDIGPYRECGVSVAVVPRGQPKPRLPLLQALRASRVGFHVLDLPVTTSTACAAGRELWGYPKFVTAIDWNLDGLGFSGIVRAPDSGRPILSLAGKRGPGLPLPMVDLLLYSQRGRELLRTRVGGRGGVHTGSGRGLVLHVGDGEHAMAYRLRELGLDGASPLVAQVGTHLRSVLPAGSIVGERGTVFDVVDEAVFDASPAEVFTAVRDESAGRSHWWRPTLELRPRPGTPAGQVGGVFDVSIRRGPPMNFTARITELVENQRIRLEYIGGDFVGEDLWTFEPVDGRTRMRFRWRARPNRWPMRLASRIADVERIHSEVVQRGFEGLRRYLRAQPAPVLRPPGDRPEARH